MPDDIPGDDTAADQAATPVKKSPAKRTAAKKTAVKKAPAKRSPAKKATAAAPADASAPVEADPVTPPATATAAPAAEPVTADEAPAKKAARSSTRKTAAKKVGPAPVPATENVAELPAVDVPTVDVPTATPVKRAAARRTTKKVAQPFTQPVLEPVYQSGTEPAAPGETKPVAAAMLFQAPDPTAAPTRRTRSRSTPETPVQATDDASIPTAAEPSELLEGPAKAKRPARKRTAKVAAPAAADDIEEVTDEPATVVAASDERPADAETPSDGDDEPDEDSDGEGGGRRRRRRGGRRRRKSGESGEQGSDEGDQNGNGRAERNNDSGGRSDTSAADDDAEDGGEASSRRRRRRRRGDEGDSGDGGGNDGNGGRGGRGGRGGDDPDNTVTRVRRARSSDDEITSISGSTRLEAKKQRRRDGREAGRRRAPIVSESEFLARREAVDRVMVIRQTSELTQIGVLEDKVLVEHYVARESQTSLIGNVYLGRVQNVLPSMEAAFVDIGKGRNAVLYAGEVNWSGLGHRDGQPRKIESVLSSGQSILVQVTKDPIGQKGARLTSQISLAGRFLVYVPDGTTSGISRKLPDTERSRLKTLLKEIVPDSAGVIVRTAAEGASEEELTSDVERLKARWEDIEAKAGGNAPQMLYGEPDLTLKVVRDLFTEDFAKLVIEGEDAWETVRGYVAHVAPDLQERLERYEPGQHTGKDIFSTYRVEEQIAKGLDRKVWLPSGGSLVIDRTEAMTVVDVNTGKFTGSGGNLEETVTKNNLEAAEEMVRQLRLRDIGGIIVIDFIDMVLESNRDLVLRRLVECLGRDRTRHQVAEVTSLGLVQMTRKRIGTGLVESFSENCEHCQGRGVIISDQPVEAKQVDDDSRRGGARRARGGRRGQEQDNGGNGNGNGNGNGKATPSPLDVAAMARQDSAERQPVEVEEVVEAEAIVSTPELVETPGSSLEVEAATLTDTDTGTDTDIGTDTGVSPPQAPEAEQPKVVTRTRRRAASRPAGSPQQPAPEPVVVTASETPAAPDAETVQAAAVVVVAAPAERPKVVTRARGQRAARPAAAGSGDEAHAPAPDVETDAPEVEQVTVKRRRTRNS